MRVALFGAYDPTYPRTRVLREGLEARGIEVVPIRAGRLDAILVPSFGHRDVPLAAILGKIAVVPVLFDPLVSRWDTQVGDLGRLKPGTLSALRVRWSDRMALAIADRVLCDTWEHGDLFSNEFRVPRPKLSRVPVGADRFTFQLGERRAGRPRVGPLEVVYVGGYLPLHGVPTVVDAATEILRRRGPRFATFSLIGDGMTLPRVRRDVAARGLVNVRFFERMPYEEAMCRLAEADLGLGIFGQSPKSARVVPHKVFQSLALGVPTITRRSAAIAEFFRDEEQIVLVPPGDGAALARAIEALADDPARRERIGAQGRAAALSQASPPRIGELLEEAIRRTL